MTSHQVIGRVRPPISWREVKYYDPPPGQFEEVAVLDLDMRHIEQVKTWKDLGRIEKSFRDEAAKLGANGFMLQNGDGSYLTYVLKSPLATPEMRKRTEGRAKALAIFVPEK